MNKQKVSEERLREFVMNAEADLAFAQSLPPNMLGREIQLERERAKVNAFRELLTLRQSKEWQPIETAPRDSRRILVGYFNFEGEWRVHEAWWRMPYEVAPAKQCWWCYDGDKTLLSADVHQSPEGKKLGATYWMPLPPYQGGE